MKTEGNFVVYIDNGEGLKPIPTKTHPSETIMNTLKTDYGIKNPIMMQQSRIEFYEVTIMGHDSITFRVYDKYIAGKKFIEKFLMKALVPYTNMTSFSVDIEEDRVILTVDGERLVFPQESYTKLSIRDIKDKLRRLK